MNKFIDAVSANKSFTVAWIEAVNVFIEALNAFNEDVVKYIDAVAASKLAVWAFSALILALFDAVYDNIDALKLFKLAVAVWKFATVLLLLAV